MRKFILYLAISLWFLGSIIPVRADDSLLETLRKKGVLTEEEVSAIMAEQEKERKSLLPKAFEGLSIGALAYLDYSAGTKDKNGTDFNKFSLTRGYVNIRKDINPWLKARITPDVTQLSNGDIELRMKYYYVDLLLPDRGFFTERDLRIGLAHTPYLDFQEAINIYRLQGTMFQERFGNFNSADLGIGVIGNLGGKLSKEQQEEVGYSSPYSGRYGSYHIGLYNGGGYHANEANQNKVIEGRVTLRPLPDSVPGLQLTYFGISGKGNKASNPEWKSNSALVSYQNRRIVITGEYVKAKGKQNGDDERNKSGYSIFGDFRLPVHDKISLMARYDVWDPDTDAPNDKETLTIGGVSYKLYGNNYILVAYEQRQYDTPGSEDDKKGQVVYQLSF